MLPCLNEAIALPQLLARLADVRSALLPGTMIEALVIDDGSTDATAEVAQHMDSGSDGGLWVHLVQHGQNRGLGAALLTGIKWFAPRSSAGDCLAVMDADGTHPPSLLPQLLAQRDRGAEVIIASRYARGGSESGLPPMRRIYSRGASLLLAIAA